MYTIPITYTDYDGNERTEEHSFNLSQAELIKFLTTNGDYTLDKMLLRLQSERNGREIMKIFEDLIYLSYGKKSLDGRRFDKSEEVKKDFMETEAYSVLFTSLVTDAKAAGDFVNKIIPKKLAEQVQKVIDEHPEGIPAELKEYVVRN